jgi:hypothetical protein
MEPKMNKHFLFFVLMFLPLFSIANTYCDDLNEKHDLEQEIIPSDKSGYKVIANSRLFFLVHPI